MSEIQSHMKVSATIIAFNEERDLGGCLESLTWCDEIVVVDSGSNDRTIEIAKAYNARIFVLPFQGFSEQKNFAAEQASNEWIISVDADERVSPELRDEICRLLPDGERCGYFVPRLNLWLSRPIRHSGWYPDYTLRLYRKECGKWQGVSHEQVVVTGKTAILGSPMVHNTVANMHDHLRKGLLSSVLELKEAKRNGLRLYWIPPRRVLWECLKGLWSGPKTLLGLRLIYKRHIKNKVDLVWLLPCYPVLRFVYMYIVRLGCLDGASGFWLAYTSGVVESMKYLRIWEHYIHQLELVTPEEETMENPATLYRSIS